MFDRCDGGLLFRRPVMANAHVALLWGLIIPADKTDVLGCDVPPYFLVGPFVVPGWIYGVRLQGCGTWKHNKRVGGGCTRGFVYASLFL